MDSHSVDGTKFFLSDRILDERSKVQPGMPLLASTERIILEALAYIVTDIEDRKEMERRNRG